ncbi:MAG: hypothetical protein CMH21_02730 [Methylophaga sp.]|jgi:hypothetical protein|nr:hypothetical protein [Methylophaga sp.]MAY16638.1 hypothetical protein [Methylophaga sp.]MBN44860.1 hypothetical protein [Methylophaga sp.]
MTVGKSFNNKKQNLKEVLTSAVMVSILFLLFPATVSFPNTLIIQGKRIKWLILPLHESETDRHLIGLSG